MLSGEALHYSVTYCTVRTDTGTRWSTRKDLAARPAEIVLGHERDDRAGDLPAALRGRLDRIGEIVVLVTDKPKIDDRNARSGSFADDRVVDNAQRRRTDPSPSCIGIVRVVNRTDRNRQAAMPHGFNHPAIISCELAADRSQLFERIGD